MSSDRAVLYYNISWQAAPQTWGKPRPESMMRRQLCSELTCEISVLFSKPGVGGVWRLGRKYLHNVFLPDFLRCEENINQINDAYLSNNQEPDREFIMLTMGNKTMEECGAFEIYRLACLH